MSVIVTPSTFHIVLPVFPPCTVKLDCCPDCEPPTFCRSMTTPGVCSMTTHGSRADGMNSSISLLNVSPVFTALVSTIGLSPVTVTVSCTVDRPSRTLISALNPVVMRMSVRTSVWNPCSSNKDLLTLT
jgi:hypothetical protein